MLAVCIIPPHHIACCSVDELQYIMVRIVSSAKSLTLTDDEVAVFWAVHQELQERKNGKNSQLRG